MTVPPAIRALGAFLLLVLAWPAAAADPGVAEPRWYLGGGLGFARSQNTLSRFSQPRIVCVQPALGRTQGCVRQDGDAEFTGTLFGGFEYNRYFALEAGYTDLPGSFEVNLVDPNVPPPAVIDVQQDSRALYLQGVFTLPLAEVSPGPPLLERLSLSATLGAARWRSTSELLVDVTGSAGGFRSAARDSDTGTGAVFGARLNYDATEHVRVSAAWSRFRNLGDSASALLPPLANPNLPPFTGPPVATVKEDVDVFTLNLSYRF